MAIKCHSSFVHYNMFHNHHCHGGGNNYGSIFNIQHNCGGGTNFWGGLGAGIGYGLGGMFSGLFGGFGNMFGGFGNMFGMGNMFGGFGGFGLGGFGGFASSLGTYFGYELAEGLDGLFSRKDKDRTKINKKDKDDDVKKDDDANKDVKPEDDKAYENINKLHEKANSFLNKNVTEINLKELASLLIEIENYKLADEFKSTENNEQLNNIKTQLLNIQKQAQEAGKEGEDDASLVQAVNDLEGYKKLSDEQKGQVTKGQAISIIKDFEQNEAGEYKIRITRQSWS